MSQPHYALVLIAALAFALTATPLFRRLAVRINFVDQPNARKLHNQPIPLMGGLAIYGGIAIALFVFGEAFYVRELAGIAIGATLCAAVGLWDDRNGMRASVKMAFQLGAAIILVVSGVQVQLFAWQPLNWLLTILWTVGITNALNLLDNMDGLSSSICIVAATYMLLLAALSGQYLVGLMCASLVGACIGFLVYNAPPASIFMGDAGSLLLGFMLSAAAIKLRFPANITLVTWMIPLFVLGIPIFDTTLVIISRTRRGLNPLTHPGKDHVSHRLVRMGYTKREAVLSLCLAGGALGIAAVYISQAAPLEAYIIGAVALAAAVWMLYRLLKLDNQNTAVSKTPVGEGNEQQARQDATPASGQQSPQG